MADRDLKITLASILKAELTKHDDVVQPGCVKIVKAKIGKDRVTMIVSNRAEEFRVLIFYPDGSSDIV